VRILSDTDTFAEQAVLFEKYEHGGPLAARRHSSHNFGIAWDVGIFNEQHAYIDDLIDKKAMTSKAVEPNTRSSASMERRSVCFGVAIGATRIIRTFRCEIILHPCAMPSRLDSHMISFASVLP
jgi:hypothetical protein